MNPRSFSFLFLLLRTRSPARHKGNIIRRAILNACLCLPWDRCVSVVCCVFVFICGRAGSTGGQDVCLFRELMYLRAV